MDKKITLKRGVLNAEKLTKSISTQFTTFVEPVPEQDPDTIQELFRLYDKLYLEIPAEGETNSHEYLVKKSSEIYKSEELAQEIQPLLDEIAQLRTRILELQQENIDTIVDQTETIQGNV
jgi:hypothetical protein